jgi:fructose/tagatose bisphosphate aldolase
MSITADRIDAAIEAAVFAPEEETRQQHRREIKALAASLGIYPASIQGLYEAAGKGLYQNKTVPAMNLRGLTYQMARAVFRAALKNKVGAFVFEIARSEIGYTKQSPAEYTACVLAAAIKEGFRGPVFIQGDHYQVNAGKYGTEPGKELKAIEALIRESVDAGFLNIDIDASTVVDLKQQTLEKQQEKNYLITADLTKFIRRMEPKGVSVSVGGEIGEVGGRNSTVEDLRAFITGYKKLVGSGVKGISKISVQTGTTHGGVVLPDGSLAKVQVDFNVLEELSRAAREEYGMAGAVQHGASTLPEEAFSLFPKAGTAEVHLATGFQNMIYDSPYFPQELMDNIAARLVNNYSHEAKKGETREQFLYKTRKKAFGDFKKEIWSLPEESVSAIGEELESRFSLLFQELNVVSTVDLVGKYVGDHTPSA